jgi:hypothetical protein
MITRVRHGEHVGEKSNAYRVLMGKYERKELLGRPWFRYEDNIKVNLELIS